MKCTAALEQIPTIPVQISLLVLSSIFLLAMLYKPISEFHPLNKLPEIYTAAPYDTDIIHIKTGLHITDFLKFDALKNEYIINAVIWFSYDPHQISLETISKFSFSKGEILQKSDPILSRMDNLHTALYYIRIQFSTIPDYRRFPLDDHYLFLNVINTAISPRNAIFEIEPNRYKISANLHAPGWNIVEHTARAGFVSSMSNPESTAMQPKVSYALGLSKRNFRQLILIMLPLLVLFYLGVFSLSITKVASAMALILASTSGLLAYSFVTQTLSPSVGYLMLSDYLFLLCLGVIFVVFFITILQATPKHILSPKKVEQIKGAVILGIYAVLIVCWYYLTHVKNLY